MQGAVAEIFLKSGDLINNARGMASLVKKSWMYSSKLYDYKQFPLSKTAEFC